MSSIIHPGVLAVIYIVQLGSPSYQKREMASRSLGQLAPVVLPYLEAARKHPDAEVARRSNLILVSYYEQAAESLTKKARPAGWPCLPWLDMLPKDYPNRTAVVEIFLAQARDKMGRKGPPDWGDYRLATELYLKHLFRSQQTLEEVNGLLEIMASRETVWINENGKNYTPPLRVPGAQDKLEK